MLILSCFSQAESEVPAAALEADARGGGGPRVRPLARMRARWRALRGELDALNRQLEATCTLRLQPRDASDSQVWPADSSASRSSMCARALMEHPQPLGPSCPCPQQPATS